MLTNKVFILILTGCLLILLLSIFIIFKNINNYKTDENLKNKILISGNKNINTEINKKESEYSLKHRYKKSQNAKTKLLKANNHKDYFPDKEWDISTPEEQGMDSEILLNMFKTYDDRGTILIIKNGYLVTNYNQTFLTKDLHHVFSCTKSIISTLIGIAYIEGYIKDIDQKVLSFFPDSKIENMDDRKKNLTIYHLLTMTSGLDWNDSPEDVDSVNMSMTNDWAQYVLNKPMIYEPGQEWYYNGGCSQLLSVILSKTTGMSAMEYAQNKIFNPLGITNIEWEKDPQGFSTGAWGLYLTSFDLAKIGYLFLREGRWKDKQIIPKSWIAESTENHFPPNAVISSDLNGFVYGYQWWVYTDLPYRAFKAWGGYDEEAVEIIVIPELDLVVVLAGDNGNDKDILKSYVLPSVKSSESLSPNINMVNEMKNILGKYN